MTKKILIVLLMAMLLFALAPVASADVHRVSQANCAADGAPSGGIGSRHAIEHGRPAGQIPVVASDGRTQGRGGEADAQGQNC